VIAVQLLVMPLYAGDKVVNPPTNPVETEIRQLHQFFQDWYRGNLADADFQRFAGVMGEDFEIILPDAAILARQRIIDAVRGQKGSDAQAELWIDNVRVVHQDDAFIIATYEEWQGRAGQPARGRLSTVVFRPDSDAPNGLVWLHVHETWLPADD